MQQKIRGTVLTILSAVIFGFSPLLVTTFYSGGGNVFSFTFSRLLAGVILFPAVHRLTSRESLRLTRDELKRVAICCIGFAIAPILLFASYNYIAGGLATTLHFVYPVLILLGCVFFYREPLNRRKALCCFLCMVGILSFYTPGGEVSLFGVIIALLSGLAYAFYTVYSSKSGILAIPPFKLAFWTNLICWLYVAIPAACLRQFSWPTDISPYFLVALSSTLLCIASVCFQLGNKYVGAQSAGLYSTFEPLTSVVVGVVVSHELLTPRAMVGIVCILLAVCLLALDKEGT